MGSGNGAEQNKHLEGKKMLQIYDLMILGGGAAGLSAGVYSARKLLKTCIIAKEIGGQVLLTSGVENYMGFEFISGPELIQKFEDQLNQFPIEQILGERVERLTRQGEKFLAITEQGKEVLAKSVVVATGKRSRELGATGEKGFAGRGVSYCATCDGPFFKDMPVAVIGGGNSAFETAMDMLKLCPVVYLVNIMDKWQADEILQERVLSDPKLKPMLKSKVKEIKGDDKVRSMVVETKQGDKELEVKGVFVEVGMIPNSEFAKGFLELNSQGEIIVDCHCRTSVAGVFGAGDVTTVPEKQIIISAGEGAKAVLSAYRWLIANQKI